MIHFEILVPRVVITWATVLLVVLVGGTAAARLFAERTYSQETLSWAAQGAGQDAVDLIVALAGLSLGAIFALKGSRRGLLIWRGIVVYFIYSSSFTHFSSVSGLCSWPTWSVSIFRSTSMLLVLNKRI